MTAVVVWRGAATHRLGLVFNEKGWATVHYLDCCFYRMARHVAEAMPETTKVRLCRRCRPAEGDVRAAPPCVEWRETGRRQVKEVPVTPEFAEKILARRERGIGRTSYTGRKWED